MSDIFISYASADRDQAGRLAAALTRRGYLVWWDRTIPPGRVFDEVIQEAIQTARCMIVLWSRESVRSNWVKTEAAEGVARGMLVPALIDDATPPIEFKRIQAANLAQWDGDEAHDEYRNLTEAVEKLLHGAARAGSGVTSHTGAAAPRKRSLIAAVPKSLGTFVLGGLVTMAVVAGYKHFAKPDKGAALPPSPTVGADAAKATVGVEAAPPRKPSIPPPAARARVNLLSSDAGGEVLVAANERWRMLIDGKEDTYAWTDDGFGVFGFHEGRSALIDSFAVLVPTQAGTNLRDFELFVGNAMPNGPFESIGKFSTRNQRDMQEPYQVFRFTPVKAKYFKFQSLRNHDNGVASAVYEIQLFGELL